MMFLVVVIVAASRIGQVKLIIVVDGSAVEFKFTSKYISCCFKKEV